VILAIPFKDLVFDALFFMLSAVEEAGLQKLIEAPLPTKWLNPIEKTPK
jgi:hypothetical protein